jgi:hypothetical protein
LADDASVSQTKWLKDFDWEMPSADGEQLNGTQVICARLHAGDAQR